MRKLGYAAGAVLVVVIAGFLLLRSYILGNPASTIEDVVVSFADVDRFVVAQSEHGANSQALTMSYLDAPGRGAEVLTKSLGLNAANLDQSMDRNGRIYAGMPTLSSQSDSLGSDIQRAFDAFQARYPAAVFPEIYVAPGSFDGRAIIQPGSVVVFAAEYFLPAKQETLQIGDAGELVTGPQGVVSQAVHELVHIQRARVNTIDELTNRNLLPYSMREGTADFIAWLLTGSTTYPRAMAYGRQNEVNVWCEFQAEIDASDRGEWFSFDDNRSRPYGVGAFIGFRIAEAFYENAVDKDAAFEALVRLDDYGEVLSASGYGTDIDCR